MEALKLQNVYLNERQLKEMAVKLAKDIWGANFNLPIVISRKMTSTLGYFQYNRITKTGIKIQISHYLVNGNYTYETVESVMKHELCHWYLFITGQPHSDTDPTFRREVVRIGSHVTFTIKPAGELHQAKCKCCGQTFEKRTEKQMRNFVKKYRCGKCRGEIVYIGAKYIEDKNSKHITRQTNVEVPKQPQINHKQSEIKKAADTSVNTGSIKIESIIQPGPKGVTNLQMIPAIKLVLDGNSKEKLNLLKKTYPEVFQSSLKYIGKKYLDKLNNLI